MNIARARGLAEALRDDGDPRAAGIAQSILDALHPIPPPSSDDAETVLMVIPQGEEEALAAMVRVMRALAHYEGYLP